MVSILLLSPPADSAVAVVLVVVVEVVVGVVTAAGVAPPSAGAWGWVVSEELVELWDETIVKTYSRASLLYVYWTGLMDEETRGQREREREMEYKYNIVTFAE